MAEGCWHCGWAEYTTSVQHTVTCLQATCEAVVEAQPALLPLLHTLEGTSSGSQIAPLAETLLEEVAVYGGQKCSAAVFKLRNATKAAKKELAMKKRQAMLATLGLDMVSCRCDASPRSSRAWV